MQERIRFTPENPMQGKGVAIVGGGPAGSFEAYKLAKKGVNVDIFEPHSTRQPDFAIGERRGVCVGCAGLFQHPGIVLLENNGITISEEVIQVHLQGSTVHFPSESKTVYLPADGAVTVYRGFGPVKQETGQVVIESFDSRLLSEAIKTGATHHQTKIVKIDLQQREGKVHVIDANGKEYAVDTVIGAYGHDPKHEMSIVYPPDDKVPLPSPKTQKAGVREYYLGREKVKELLKDQIHIFGNPTEGSWFAAVVPKKDNLTVVLMGRDKNIRDQDFTDFFANKQVRELLKGVDENLQLNCACMSLITLKSPERFMVRGQNNDIVMVNIGDSGPTTPRKNGIFAALDSASHLAETLIKNGNSASGLEEYRRYIERRYVQDNFWSEAVLRISDLILNHSIPRKAVIFSANHNIPLLSEAVRSTMSHILTGRDSYWRIPINVLKEVVRDPIG